MDIVVDGNFEPNTLVENINRRVREMIKQGELCSHCKENKAKGVSILMERRYDQGDLIQIFIHTIPVCKCCSQKGDLDELNAKKISEDYEAMKSSMKIIQTGLA
jgi:hypothetical protein